MEKIKEVFSSIITLPAWKQKLLWFIVNRKTDTYLLRKGFFSFVGMRYANYRFKKANFSFNKIIKLTEAIDKKYNSNLIDDEVNSIKEFIIFLVIVIKKTKK